MNHGFFKLLVGKIVDNRYKLKEVLGVGSFGAVYRAEERVADSLLRQVALKLIPPHEDVSKEKQFKELELVGHLRNIYT